MKKYLAKINTTILILMPLFLLNSCKTIDLPHKQGTVNDAIFNCIYDFRSINKGLMKKDTVFAVISEEEDDFFRIIIVGSNNKYLYNSNRIPSDNKMRSNYYETDNKLFIWYDDTKEIDEKTIQTYLRFNLLVDNIDGTIFSLDTNMDDSKKGAIYYICKNDLTNFRKKISNKVERSHPNLHCK